MTIINFDPKGVDKNFPLLIDDFTLSKFIGITNRNLWYLLSQRNNMEAYKCFSIPRKTKVPGVKPPRREIQEPLGYMKVVHARLNKVFCEIPLDESVAAYRKGKRCADSARRHVRPSYVFPVNDEPIYPHEQKLLDDPRYQLRMVPKLESDTQSEKVKRYHQPVSMIKMDIKNFFPSIKASWIRSYFCEAVGYSNHVASLLATLCSVKRIVHQPNTDPFEVRHLPQGSPLSGSLANLVAAHRFGNKLVAMLKKHSPDWVMTIYSDDIIMTHPTLTISKEELESVKEKAESLVKQGGFEINTAKSKIKHDKCARIRILGCIVTHKLNIPSTVRKQVGNAFHKCLKYGFAATCPPDKNVNGYVMYLQGMIEHVKSIRPDLAAKYTDIFNQAKERYHEEVQPDIVGGELT